MKIIDISPEHENTYFCCLEDWSDEMKEAGDNKKKWYERMKDKGEIRGMIQYMPIEPPPSYDKIRKKIAKKTGRKILTN